MSYSVFEFNKNYLVIFVFINNDQDQYEEIIIIIGQKSNQSVYENKKIFEKIIMVTSL